MTRGSARSSLSVGMTSETRGFRASAVGASTARLRATVMLVSRKVSRESQKWHDTYRATELVARRASSHRRKIERLGVFELPRDARVLDLACGSGEALHILHDAGFSRLYGVDVTADE